MHNGTANRYPIKNARGTFYSLNNQKSGSHNPVRILLVEDNPAEIHLFRMALDGQNQECDLHEIRDGAAALQYIEEYRKTCVEEPEPCVIVLDMHLPKHVGPTVLRAIKHEPVLSHVHVVVLTTCASPREELEVRQLGVSRHLRIWLPVDQRLNIAERGLPGS